MEKTTNTHNGKKINERKLQLIELSKEMRGLVKLGQAESINDALKKFVYQPAGHTVLKTLKEWNEEGKKIIKGSHALLLWSAPLKGKVKQEKESTAQNEATEDEEYKFWNVCYLFSNLQIIDR